MSAQAEAESKQTKRKRSSKNQLPADEHTPKRLKNGNVSTPREPPTSNPVNGALENRNGQLSPQVNEEPKSHHGPNLGQSSQPRALEGKKRKRKSDIEGEKINGYNADATREHDKPTSQVRSPSPVQALNQINGLDLSKLQNTELERQTSPHDGVDSRVDNQMDIAKKGKKPRKKKRDGAAVIGTAQRGTPSWNVTEPLGGHFIHHDPLFSPDERYIFVAHRRAVHIYSVSTSLLVRRLPVDKSEVTSIALSTAQTDNIYVACKNGVVLLWNWVTGDRLAQWSLPCHIVGLWTTLESSTEQDTVFTIDRQHPNKRDTITAHRLSYGQNPTAATSVQLFAPPRYLQGLRILARGEVIVAFSHQGIALGQISTKEKQPFSQKTYIWREFDCANEISCFDARVISKKKRKQKDCTFVDVVVGTMNGPIFMYSDILNKLVSHTQPKEGNSTPSILDPRRYHWHREAVGTVKWSKDGNYLISGGKETVLVLWQLETSKQQYLPHLTSDIQSLVISPSGAAYAVRLVDNSLMVLSTSELKPKTHVAGIQAQEFIREGPRPRAPTTLQTLYNSSQDPVDSILSIRAAFSPLSTNHLLLVVPSSQPTDRPASQQLSASYLQTFDVTTAKHVSRQALTRNNATNFNKGPEGIKLEDPNVKLMRLSCDGKWLATVDEWVPPMMDTDFLAANIWSSREEQLRRREVYLKFWVWSDEQESWVLETRVDVPHQSSDGISAGSVDDIVSDPDRVGFATVGEDGIVRIWTPRTVFPNNRAIRGVRKGGVVNWSCQSSTKLEDPQKRRHVTYDRAHPFTLSSIRLAYSPDGSVLAACQSLQDTPGGGLLQLIDTASGDVAFTRTVPAQDLVLGIGFLEKHIVILSDQLIVWDPVEDALTYGYDLDLSSLTTHQKQHLCHIATNPSDGTFALALSQLPPMPSTKLKGKDFPCNILIFSPTDPKPLFTLKIFELATALIPGPQSSGYAIIDSSAEVRILRSTTAVSVPVAKPIAGMNESLAELTDEVGQQTQDPLRRLLGEEESQPSTDLVPAVPRPGIMDIDVDARENDDPVVRSEKLAEILDFGSSSSLPPVQDMFNAVVRLFAKKPRTVREMDSA